ncbi:SGS domain-containing protein [Artemisia annua]|uniref:SGS domain-containing protein n=1 Tax=Artemisia annua TaxID=35608 RepID=A0A2U1KI32_ARTAN|nr:SGS domain-containing protein [Artemisia annua]
MGFGQLKDAAPVAPTPTPGSRNQKVAAEPTLKYTTIGSFSWDQDNDKVMISVFLEGIDQEKVQAEFNAKSVDIKFHDVQGKNYRCAILQRVTGWVFTSRKTSSSKIWTRNVILWQELWT